MPPDTMSAIATWSLTEPAAEAYDQHLVPSLFMPWAQRMMAAVPPRRGQRVLDIGCGTGAVARCARQKVGPDGRVVGLDRNDVMLAVARRKNQGPGLEWRQGDAMSLPFGQGEFDVVASSQVMPFLPDPAAAVNEMARVMAPGGRLALASWRGIGHNPGWQVLADVLEQRAGRAAGDMMRAPFAGPQRDELGAMLRGAGLQDVRVEAHVEAARYPSVEEFVMQEAAASPMAAVMESMGSGAMDSMVQDLAPRLEAHMDDAGVVFPMQSWIATARKA